MHRVITRSQQQNRHAQTQQFGVHLLLDGYHGSARQLADKAAISTFLEALPSQLGMHRITEPVVVEVGPQNRKDPGGVSGFVMIAESHISLHTFPLRGFISADVYTCQDSLDIGSIVQRFRDAFSLQSVDEHYIKRGLNYPANNIYESQQGVRSGCKVEGRDYGY